MTACVEATYIVVDTSGSTVTDRWIDACNSVLPHVMEALEADGANGTDRRRHISVITYGTESDVVLRLSEVDGIDLLPGLWADGFSSMAAGLETLARTAASDLAQLRSDGFAVEAPTAVVVAHGLPTDPPGHVIEVRRSLGDLVEGIRVVGVAPEGTDPLALAGLGLEPFRLVPPESAGSMLPAAVIDLVGLAIDG